MIKCRHLSHAPHKKVQENPLLMDFPELGGDEEDRTLDLGMLIKPQIIVP
jgi:hypothetical protein